MTPCEHDWQYCCTYDVGIDGDDLSHDTCTKCFADRWEGEESEAEDLARLNADIAADCRSAAERNGGVPWD